MKKRKKLGEGERVLKPGSVRKVDIAGASRDDEDVGVDERDSWDDPTVL